MFAKLMFCCFATPPAETANLLKNAKQRLFSSKTLEVMNALKEWIKSLTDYRDG